MALTLISTPLDITVDDTPVATVDITSGITDTYDSYEFHCVNMHPENNSVDFTFQVNAATGDNTSGFNQVMTSTHFEAYHKEFDGHYNLQYNGGQAQTQLYQTLFGRNVGNDVDLQVSGILTLYAPSSPTYVKHFTSVGNAGLGDWTLSQHIAGYINTTAAIDEISFKFSSGNIDAGTIKMFGVS
jgi:hypothetical protein